ncbi:hypothetical protein HHI36_000347 [Cryptolaemus montrouzieri]|uniref:Uncharacterized protein n=1 Tax=Cryptolaemus montrouzieri TaxID=559131 RepID=A0ABD2P4P9_9CUCU
MSVSLDYIEDSTKPPVSLGTDNDVIFIEDVKNQSVVEDRKSLNNSVPMMDKSSRRGSGVQGDRRSLSSISPQMKDKRLSQETNKPKVSPRKTKSCNEMDESETSPKKKKSSSKTDDLISLSMRYNGDGSGYEAEEENKSNSEEHKYSFKDSKDTKKKRKSSKINTQSAENEGSEEAEIYEPVSEAEVEDEIINQKVNISLNSSKKRRSSNLQKRSSRSEEKRENENSDMDEDVESSNSTEKYIKEETEVVEKMNKGKHVEANSNKNISKSRVNKRMKMLEMCEKLTVDDLRHKIPSRSEINSSNKIIKRKELKRLQSKLRASSKNSLLSGLVTDVKNRPRRLLKPSIDVNNPGWVVEEDGVTPSSANLTCVFNVKKLNKKELKSQGSLKPSSSMSTNNTNLQKFDAKDFKNQMLYDARVRREPTSNLLRKKGYYYY